MDAVHCSLIKLILKSYQEDPRWQENRWKLYSLSPRTKLELQLNYRTIILYNQLKTKLRRSLINKDLQKKPHQDRKGRDMKRAGPLPWGAEVPEGYLSCGGSSWEAGVSTPSRGPQPKEAELGRDAYITRGCESQQGFCPPGETGVC